MFSSVRNKGFGARLAMASDQFFFGGLSGSKNSSDNVNIAFKSAIKKLIGQMKTCLLESINVLAFGKRILWLI
jgi:hypothetical protein